MEQLRIRHRYAAQVRLQEQGVIVPRQTTVFRNKALSEAWRCLGGMRGMVLRRVKLQAMKFQSECAAEVLDMSQVMGAAP